MIAAKISGLIYPHNTRQFECAILRRKLLKMAQLAAYGDVRIAQTGGRDCRIGFGAIRSQKEGLPEKREGSTTSLGDASCGGAPRSSSRR